METTISAEKLGAETGRRTVVKALVWQGIGFTMMLVVGWVLTGSAAVGSGIAVTNTALGFVSYIIHERIWAGITWGRIHLGAHS